MPDTSVPITAGTGTNIDTITTPAGDHRQVVISAGGRGGHEGRAATFSIPGRAGTTGQSLMSIHNATGSIVAVAIKKITVDTWGTVANTAAPAVIRLWKITALPTGGATLTKVAADSGLAASSASVTLLQDASANGTSSGTALTTNRPAGTVLTQELAPRLLTVAGYEAADRIDLLDNSRPVVLRALEGLVVFLDYNVATANPATNTWTSSIVWEEYVP